MRYHTRIVLFICLISMPCLAGIAYGAPKAVMTEYTYNAGDILQGKPIVHDFILKNTGNEPLTIQVKPC